MAGKGNPNWQPGKSGNPSGRPKDPVAPLARSKSVWAFKELLKLYKTTEDDKIKESILKGIIERGCGKPMQPIEGDLTGKFTMMGKITLDGKPLEFNLG